MPNTRRSIEAAQRKWAKKDSRLRKRAEKVRMLSASYAFGTVNPKIPHSKKKFHLPTQLDRSFYLRRFWNHKYWTKYQRLESLIKIDRMVFPRAIGLAPMRETFDRMKSLVIDLSEKISCWACGDLAQIRHHIISLGHGGENVPNNFVPLCKQCHAVVHPWLKTKNTEV